jgi:hypothetical protein
VEPEGSLLCSQQLCTDPYPEPFVLAICNAHVILLVLITLTIFEEEYEL